MVFGAQLLVTFAAAQAPNVAPADQPPAIQAPAPQPPVTPPPASQPPSFQPGFLDAFSRFLNDSATRLNSQFSGARESARNTMGGLQGQANDAARDAAGVAKDTAGAIVGLPNARIIVGRERCVLAANGAPDCRSAADVVCKGKGFQSGKSLDTASARKCPARVWLSGRLPSEDDCAVETFVTRAVCQ